MDDPKLISLFKILKPKVHIQSSILPHIQLTTKTRYSTSVAIVCLVTICLTRIAFDA